MDFNEIISRANQVREKYAESDIKRLGKEWDRGEYVKAFVGDVGALVKLTMAKDGFREIENVDQKLAHELADCLWSIIIIAQKYDIDLQKAFFDTMDELDERADKNILAKTTHTIK